jgi:heparan-alpha-glucosaminide N-acetyltransferase
MSTTNVMVDTRITARGSSVRVASIDVFRGLTMALMIYVNEQSEVKGLPWWNYHMKANVDAMTYVDMVFPAFLFILGMAIPLAVNQRLKKTASVGRLWVHIVLRALGLLVLGLILANAGKGDPRLIGMNTSVWALTALLGAILFWAVYPRSERFKTLFRVMRYAGLALIVVMFCIFRRTARDGHVLWICTSYPEILGLLGFTYLAVSILYVPTRGRRWASLIWFGALMGLCILSTGGWILDLNHVPLYVWPFGNGAMASIAMAGVFTSSIFTGELGSRWPSFRQKATVACGFAAATLLAGRLLTPLGISKIRATPTWCLYSIGASVLVFTLLYWICDVKKKTGWAAFVWPAGVNTLLVYLLPDIYYFLFRALGVQEPGHQWDSGQGGVIRCLLFTGCILAIGALLTKRKIRLQL